MAAGYKFDCALCRVQERHKKRKQEKKEQHKLAQGEKRQLLKQRFDALSPEEQQRKREQAQARIQERTAAKAETSAKLKAAAKDGPKLVIDLDFWDLMMPQEQKSLLSQLAFCAGLNKRAPAPCSLHFTRCTPSCTVCMSMRLQLNLSTLYS